SAEKNGELNGKTVTILVEGESKKSSDEWQGRTDGNKMVIFPKTDAVAGEYLTVTIDRTNSATLFGSVVKNISTLEAA
ncbi:MAG TPA: TRAM domain-containing protein, partial [Bacteroidota bacterium]|nr:TRAM domain-containing protein [Bacteroidota bacterium]